MRRLSLPVCLCAAVMLFAFLPSLPTTSHSAQPFNSVALAGHTTLGGAYCECGSADCICDPGELPTAARLNQDDPADNKGPVTPASSGDGGIVLVGSLVLMALARFLWR